MIIAFGGINICNIKSTFGVSRLLKAIVVGSITNLRMNYFLFLALVKDNLGR